MELTGKIIKVMPLQSGTGRNGVWKKQEYVIETAGQVARKVCFSLWGDKIDQFNIQEGHDLEISFDLESREYNGRWYTEVKAWKVTKKTADNTHASSGPPPEDFEMPTGDGMPF